MVEQYNITPGEVEYLSCWLLCAFVFLLPFLLLSFSVLPRLRLFDKSAILSMQRIVVSRFGGECNEFEK